MTGNNIKKVTQIIFKNKKYIIEDNYSLQLSLAESQMIMKEKNNQQKDGTSTNESDNKLDQKDKKDEKKIYIFRKVNHKKSDKLKCS